MPSTKSSSSRIISGKSNRSPESYESLATRSRAAEILQSYEYLSWFSFQRCESLTQTRLHFQNILAGFTPEDEIARTALEGWKEDFTPHPPRPGDESKLQTRKGKERLSSGGGAVAGPSGGAGVPQQNFTSSPNGKGKAREKASGSGSGSAPASSSSVKKKRKSGGGS